VCAAILSFVDGCELITGETVVVDGGMLIGPKIS
jgi:hypothetical protein